MGKALAALALVVGGAGAIFDLLNAFGINLTDAQQGALGGAGSLLLLVLGVFFHPDIPVGVQNPK